MASAPRERQRRRKIALACEPCRERKSRCDGRKPICSSCEHRLLGLEQCIYKAGVIRSACTDDYTKALHDRIRHLERLCVANGINTAEAPGRTSMRLTADGDSPRTSGFTLGTASVLVGTTSAAASPAVDGRTELPSISCATTPAEADDPDNAQGVTAMGAVMFEEDLTMGDFYGRSSAASFLSEATSTMRQGRVDAATTGTTERTDHASPLSVVSGTNASGSLPAPSIPAPRPISTAGTFTLPPRALADHLMQRYWQRVYYLYPFFDREAFTNAYESLWRTDHERDRNRNSNSNSNSNSSSRSSISVNSTDDLSRFRGLGLGSPEADARSIVFQSALNAVFALGSCVSDLTPAERRAATDLFFSRCKSFISLDFLMQNKMAVIQSLLVTALMLQGTPFPSHYWNAVGVACRVAQGLGLHMDGSRKPRNQREQDVRRRTWRGCILLDVLVSMTFGRPTMTSGLSLLPDPPYASETGPETYKMAFQSEGLRLSRILEAILEKVYQPWHNRDSDAGDSSPHSLDDIVRLDQQLASFEQTVHPCVSWTTATTATGRAHMPPRIPKMATSNDLFTVEIQRNVLRTMFIYSKLILHRPALSQLAATATKTTSHSSSMGLAFALESGKSCFRATRDLVVLVHEIYAGDKGGFWWWNELYAYTAGLVLIVARLCPSLWNALDHAEVESLWEKCQAILQHQASFSAPAEKSLGVLLKVHKCVQLKQAAQENGMEKAASPLDYGLDRQDKNLAEDPMLSQEEIGLGVLPQATLENMDVPTFLDSYMTDMMGPMLGQPLDFLTGFGL